MKSFVLDSKANLHLVDKDSKKLEKNEVRLKIAYTNICGSDIKNYNNPKKLGITLGHEASAKVIECALGVNEIKVDDRVCIFPMIACFECNECLHDNHRDCNSKVSVGFDLDGTYAQELIIDSRALIKIDDALDDIQGANLEPLACSNRLVKELLLNKVDLNSNIIVIGDGPIGIGNGILLKLYGYNNISLIGKYQYRMDIARKIYPEVYHHTQDELFTNNVDVVVYSANAAQTLDKILEKNNKITICPQVRLPLDIRTTQDSEIKLSRAFAYKYSDFSDIQDFMLNGKIDNTLLITKQINFNQIEDFDDLVKDKNQHLKITIKVS